MALRITKWKPDTVEGVEIDLEWDDSVPQNARTHTIKNIKFRDGAVADMFTGTDLEKAAKIMSENQNKNKAVDVIASALAVQAAAVEWSITKDAQRRFTFNVPGRNITNTTKDQIRSSFGIDVI